MVLGNYDSNLGSVVSAYSKPNCTVGTFCGLKNLKELITYKSI